MRYLITGGAGFIGSNYATMLMTENASQTESVTIFDKLTYASNLRNLSGFVSDSRFTFIEGDICNAIDLDLAMSGIDTVVHFAAESHVDRSIHDSSAFMKTNVLGTQLLLESAKKNMVKTIILVSTDEVYGSLSEGSANEKYPLEPNSPYAASKAAAELVARSYVKTYGLDIRITRSCNNYGIFQYPEKVIPVFIRQILLGERLSIYGDGGNIRQWIHVLDHCKGIQLVLEEGSPGEIYNLGTDTNFSNLDLAKQLLTEFGKGDDLINFVEDRLGHDFRYSVNFDKITKLGFKESVPWLVGIQSTIKWYKDNQDWWD